MALAIFCVWLYFVVAFITVRIFFPDLISKRRSRKEIKAPREYDNTGYDQRGFTPLGYHRNGTRYDDEGYDRDGLDKDGNSRPDDHYDSDHQVTMSVQKRKGIVAAILVPLAVVLIIVPLINFAVNDSCLFGHTPVYTFCETPIKCTKCEKEIEAAPGHKWIKDAKTGQEVCVKCQTVRSDTSAKSVANSQITS